MPRKTFSRSFSFSLFLSFVLSITKVFAANLGLEQIASEIANQVNANPPKSNDGFTTVLQTRAVGKNVIFSNVWNYRLDTPKYKVDQLVSEWKADMIPKVCQNHVQDEAFKQGLYYTFIYFDLNQNKVTEYSVSRDTCASLRR